jgi:hypothetical protein
LVQIQVNIALDSGISPIDAEVSSERRGFFAQMTHMYALNENLPMSMVTMPFSWPKASVSSFSPEL